MKNILILVLLSFGTNAFAQVFLEQAPFNDFEGEGPFTVTYEMRSDSAFRIIINEYSVKKIPDGKIYQESGREIFLFKVTPRTTLSLDDIKTIDQYGSITKPLSRSAVRYGKWPVAIKREIVRTQETVTLNGTILESNKSTVSGGIDNRILGVEIFGALVILGIPYAALLLWLLSEQVFMSKLVGCFLVTVVLALFKQKELMEMVLFDLCLMALVIITIMMTSAVLYASWQQMVEQIIPPEKPAEN